MRSGREFYQDQTIGTGFDVIRPRLPVDPQVPSRPIENGNTRFGIGGCFVAVFVNTSSMGIAIADKISGRHCQTICRDRVLCEKLGLQVVATHPLWDEIEAITPGINSL